MPGFCPGFFVPVCRPMRGCRRGCPHEFVSAIFTIDMLMHNVRTMIDRLTSVLVKAALFAGVVTMEFCHDRKQVCP